MGISLGGMAVVGWCAVLAFLGGAIDGLPAVRSSSLQRASEAVLLFTPASTARGPPTTTWRAHFQQSILGALITTSVYPTLDGSKITVVK